MSITEILNSDLNVNITINSNELRDFLKEVVIAQQPKPVKDEEFLSVDEVCALTKKVRSTLWVWERRGYLVPTSRIGKVLRYKKSDVLNLMNGGRV